MTDIQALPVDRIARRAAEERLIFESCRDDLEVFIRTFGKAIDKRTGKLEPMDFEDRPYQLEFVREVKAHDQIALLKARQIGFSTVLSWLMYWQTAFYANAPVIYTSYLADDAKRILRNIRTVFAPSLPDWMKRRLPEITNDAVQEIMFSNGSYIELRASGGGDPGRGTPARLIIADEFPAMLKPSDVIASAAPAVEDGGKLILGGTMTLPEGTFFKELWEDADRGVGSGWRNLFYGWQAVKSRDHEWYEATASKIRERHKLVMEHPSSPEEAFTFSGRLVFDPEVLAEQLLLATPGQVGRLERVPHVELGEVIEFVPDEDGYVTVWVDPDEHDASGFRAVMGADAAQGVQGGDYACAVVLSKSGRVLAEWHRRCDAHVMAEEIDKLGRFYDDALIGVERNGSGEAVLGKLLDLEYPALFRDEKRVVVGSGVLATLGWTTNTQSKHALKDATVEAIADRWLQVPSADTIRELRGYVINERQQLSGSPHDDRVIATMLAVMMVRFEDDPAAVAKPNDVAQPYTLRWFHEQDAYRRAYQRRTVRREERRRKAKFRPPPRVVPRRFNL